MSEKDEYDMNIYILADNSDDIIKKIEEAFKSKNNDKNIIEQNITSYWKWMKLNGKEDEQIIEILGEKMEASTDKDNNQSFKEVLIIDANRTLEEFLERLNDTINAKGQHFHPFIIFLTKENDSINYKEYKDLDEKKIFFIDYQDKESFIKELIIKLIQCCSYYNELGDYFDINGYPYQSISDCGEYSTYLNILILGRSQAGKSTFINLLLNEKRAKEGGNNCQCSKKCQKYKVLNYPIRLYDTVGFGDEDKNVKDIENFFKKMDEEMINAKEKIHLILYFINYEEGNKFSKNEIKLLEEIQKRNILTLYIVTRYEYNPDENMKKYNKKLKYIYDSLKSLIASEEDYFEKFIGVNLVKKDDEDEKFGFQTIINRIYTYFKNNSEPLIKIKELYEKKEKTEKIDWKSMFEKVKDNFFFNHLKNYEETVEKYENEARNAITKAKIKAGLLGNFPIVDVISHYFVKNSLKKDIEKSFKLNKNEDKEQQKKLENEIDKKVESSFTNFTRQFVGVISGGSGDILMKSAAKSGLRIAGGWALMGFQILIGPIIGVYNMSKNGEEMIKIYKEKFEEANYDVILALTECILKGIEFFKLKSTINTISNSNKCYKIKIFKYLNY